MARAKKTDEFQEGPPRGVGDNSDAEKSVFLAHQRAIIQASEAVKVANAARQRVRKLAKADGISLKHMDAIILMLDWEPAEVREHFSTLSQYALMSRLPVGTTVDLFDGVSPDDLKKIDWHAKGFIAATTGKGTFATPPGDCPPDQVQSWMEGWSDGQSANSPAQPPEDKEAQFKADLEQQAGELDDEVALEIAEGQDASRDREAREEELNAEFAEVEPANIDKL